MSSTLDEWRAIADYHKKALAQAEAKIVELTPASAPAAEKLLSRSAVHALVAKMGSADSKKDKAGWNILIARGMIENVQGILWECYPSLRLKNSNPEGWKAARELGARDGAKWQQFGLRVIERLKKQGCFGRADDGLDDFEDTAGGCDEITWNVACELLAADAAVAVAAVAVPATAAAE